MVYKEEKWVCLREACLGAGEVREVGGIDSVGQHGRVCGQQLPVPSTRALHIMYITVDQPTNVHYGLYGLYFSWN